MASGSKVAIITGSSSITGIGAECALALSRVGYNVVINYSSNAGGAEETANLCRKSGNEAIVFQADVSNDTECRRMAQAAMDQWGRIDALVNNAAYTRPNPMADLEGLTPDDFHKSFSINVIGTYQMTRAAQPHLKAAGDSAVVNISSIGAWRSNGSSMAYTSSKGALNTMTIGLARVLAPETRVNCICPGGLLGNWTRKIMSEEGYQKRVEEAETKYPLRRPVLPVDVAETALWLITAAKTMTGEAIRMDCGQHLL
ncbi:MAG: SDR family oxidoreductase [Rhodospirillaceae bacterium]|jgi:3-oxoacyl-[acyl-carrier protein] reductase